ncbi:metallophosphoesterase [bacterium]|nr:metallophosphoesterase [bacterium]
MALCFFVSDLHGRRERYRALWDVIAREKPAAVFFGGDLLPMWMQEGDFHTTTLMPGFARLHAELGPDYPRIFLIPGNDDPRVLADDFASGVREGLWECMHGRQSRLGDNPVYGYGHVPPTPFQLKDWERYDVSRYVDPGCISPEEGRRSVAVPARRIRYTTIAEELAALTEGQDLSQAICLFHSPPYDGLLDLADLEGKSFDHVPLDPHVGSMAIQRFIAERQPLITLHGHVHESTRLTGAWRETRGRTTCFNAAHDGPELSLIRFDPAAPETATRELLS